MDGETDDRVQALIQTHLASCTILTIAHRLDTVVGSDRLLVMDAGRVAEMAPPLELSAKPLRR